MKIYKTEGKIISGFVFALLVIGVFSWITYRNMQLTYADSKGVNTSLQILRSVEITFMEVQHIEAINVDYIMNFNEKSLLPIDESRQQIRLNLDNIIRVSGNDSIRLEDAHTLSRLINLQLLIGKQVVEIRHKLGINPAIELDYSNENINLVNNIRSLVNKMEERERAVLMNENATQIERSHRTLMLFVLLAAMVLVFLLSSFMMIRNDSLTKKKANDRIAYLANLIEQSSDAIISIDKNRFIKTWNKGAEKMYGYTKEEAIGKTTVELLKSNVDVNKLKQFLEHDAPGGYWEVEVVHKRKDQTDIYVSSSISHIKDENGNSIGVVGINKDITAKKKLEEQLRTFNEELSQQVKIKTREMENVFHRITEGFVAIDSHHAFTYVNDNACLLINRKREELIGKTVEEVFPEITDMSIYLGAVDSLKNQEHKQVEFFSPMLQKWLQSNIYPSAEGLSVFFHDVTEERKNREELKASELRYRSLVEQASDSILLYDHSGNVIDVNTGICKMLGYTFDEIRLLKVQALFFEDDIRQTPLRFKEQLDGKTVLSERNMKRKDGTAVPVEINSRMLSDGLFLGIGRDITNRKQAEKELHENNIRLRDLSSHLQTVREEERTNISREIHDELGQQLTALKMDASWLNKKMNGDAAMHEKIADMISLIDETVKTIRRISADLRPVILDDIGLIAALDWYCNEFAKRTGIKCSFHSAVSELQFNKDIAICVFRICQETLTNVARHSQSTHVEVTVDVINEMMELTIKDNGQGFDLSKIKNKRTLGILGMQERAMMCSGSFNIESKSNRGTIVTLSIPVNTEKENQVAI